MNRLDSTALKKLYETIQNRNLGEERNVDDLKKIFHSVTDMGNYIISIYETNGIVLEFIINSPSNIELDIRGSMSKTYIGNYKGKSFGDVLQKYMKDIKKSLVELEKLNSKVKNIKE